jgi:hypothetical protein
MPLFISSLFLMLVLPLSMAAQSPTVKQLLQQVASGWTSDAKKALPDLLIDRPDDPAVLMLHASLVPDASRAVTLYERIVAQHGTSEWADDAQLRVLLYHIGKRDSVRARKSLEFMREQFALSDLLPVGADALRMSVGLPLPAEKPQAKSSAATPAPAKPQATTDTTAAAVDPKPYSIQVGSYSSKSDANKAAEAFKAKRMRVRVVEKQLDGQKRMVLLVGEFATEPEAQKSISTVRGICKCKAFVVKR